jgi:protein O-GlcNAc transferase
MPRHVLKPPTMVSEPNPTPPQAGNGKAEAMRRAMALHRRGQLDEAAKIYRAVLVAAPHDFDALHLLGVPLSARRQSAAGIELIKRALALQPNFAGAHNNLGTALLGAKQAEPALASFQQAIALKTDFAEAHSNLGNVLADLRAPRGGHCQPSARHCAQAGVRGRAQQSGPRPHCARAPGRGDRGLPAGLHVRPNYAKAHNNLATALVKLRCDEEAIDSFRQAIVGAGAAAAGPFAPPACA